MRFATTLTTPAAEKVISVGEARDYAKIEIDDDDDIVDEVIISATQWAEDFTRRAFLTQTHTMVIDWCFPECIELPISPVQSVTAANFTYVDATGATTQVPTSVYELDIISDPARIYLAYDQDWPENRIQRNAISIEFVAGYGVKPTQVPAPIRQAIRMMVVHHYETRQPSIVTIGGAIVNVPKTVDSLLLPYVNLA